MPIKALYGPRPVALVLGMVMATAIAVSAFAQGAANTPAPITPPPSVQMPATPSATVPTPAQLPAATPALDASTAPMIASAALPRDLSPWGMFLNADIVVKAVMVGLVFASLVTWTVWLAKNLELWKATRNGNGLRAGPGAFASSSEISTTGRSSPASFRCEPHPAALVTIVSAPAARKAAAARCAISSPCSRRPA